MHAELAAFLTRHVPSAAETAVWGGGRIALEVTTYLSSACPPLALITSVRAVLLHGDRVMVLRNADSTHIVPGGRREPGETLLATLQREVLEETGWTVERPRLLGFRHFHNLSPQLPEYAQYPYPDFVQVIYVVEAGTWQAGARLADDYEVEAAFRPLAEVERLALTPGERVFLRAALENQADC